MKTAKILFATVLAVLFMNGQVVLGQWTESGGAVYLTNLSNKVGIGTASPSSLLELQETNGTSVVLKLTEQGADTWVVQNSKANSFAISLEGSGGAELSILNTGEVRMGAGANVFFLLDASGNVGIGTANPQSKLAVDGTVSTKEVVVTDVGWSDFVFEDDYALMPLEEVERYIDEHGHLPEIPTAAEIQANGAKLGEMQAKLLQKIEELTLYLIEQQQQIAELEKSNALLRDHLSSDQR